MSASLLCDLQSMLSQWAREACTWIGVFQKQSITLSHIHPIEDIQKLQLKLGSHKFPMQTPSNQLELRLGRCSCCFDIVDKDQGTIWARFLSCHNHHLNDTQIIQHLLTNVSPPPELLNLSRVVVLYKNSEPIDAELLLNHRHLTKWYWIHITGLQQLYIPQYLEHCSIISCREFEAINGLEHTNQLESLSIQWCNKFHAMHAIQSTRLRRLLLHWCPKLQQCPPLKHPKLSLLSIHACQGLTELPSLESCPQLEEVSFCWFNHHIEIPNLSNLNKLRFLSIRSMNGLTNLPQISTNRLERIDISASNDIQTLSIHGVRLRTLIADGCQGLEFVDVENCQYLLNLSLARVPNLKELRGLENNHSLQRIQISDAPNLNHLSGLETNFELRSLTLVNCPEMTSLPNWRRLIQLQELKIYGCEKLSSLPLLPLPSLESLHLGGCTSMIEMVPLALFPNLKILRWSQFTGIEEIIDVGGLKELEHLQIQDHPTVHTIHGLKHLNKLRTINFNRCIRLQNIDSLGHSSFVRGIQLQGCQSLVALPPLFKLIYLQELSVTHCSNLRRLDCLYHHPHLKLLDISHCRNLDRLPLLHPETRKNIQRLYCTHLPQSIDISKIVGGVNTPWLQEIHLEESNVLTLRPLLNCLQLREITGLHPSDRWSILLRVAVERKDDDWIAEYWNTCLMYCSPPATEDIALACIDALDIYQQPTWNEQMFAKLREIEHSSTGDSLISAPIWERFFERLYHSNDALFRLFERVLSKQAIKIDLMREENWFPVLIDLCLTQKCSMLHIQLIEQIYQQSLFRRTPMYDHLRERWTKYKHRLIQ
jgi:hypothetical protein